jgi:hypothetical protein
MDGAPLVQFPSNKASIRLLSRGLPLEINGCSAVPDMAVAVSPNTQNVQDRPPLLVEPPLPWNDTYHGVIQDGATDASVRISSRFVDCGRYHHLSIDERQRHEEHIEDDTKAYETWLKSGFPCGDDSASASASASPSSRSIRLRRSLLTILQEKVPFGLVRKPNTSKGRVSPMTSRGIS